MPSFGSSSDDSAGGYIHHLPGYLFRCRVLPWEQAVKGKIKKDVLQRLCYNALLFANKKSECKGWTLWIRGAYKLRVTSTDDYFILCDQAEVSEYTKPGTFAMSQKDLAEFYAYVRESKDSEIDLDELLTSDPGTDTFDSLKEADVIVFPESILKLEALPPGFALHPDRLRKLSLIKPGDFPLDFRAYQLGHADMLAFRCGPTVRGAIALLDRPTLEDLYRGEELWR